MKSIIKMLRSQKIVLQQLKIKLPVKETFTGGENQLSPAEEENPGGAGLY